MSTIIANQVAKVLKEKVVSTLLEVFEKTAGPDVGADGRKIIHFENIAAYFGVGAQELWTEIQSFNDSSREGAT